MSQFVSRPRQALYLAMAALAAFLIAAPAAAKGQGANPGVIPHQATYQDLTYGQWQARWQQWAISIPALTSPPELIHPFFPGGNTLLAQTLDGQITPITGNVLFLAGVLESPAGSAAEIRSITIPSGIALFFPIVNAECSNLEPVPFHGDTPAQRADCANGLIDALDNTSSLFATIDGRAVQNLAGFRGQSPDFTFGPLPAPNILFGDNTDAGLTGQSTDVGYYLMLTPLSVGKHTIRWGGTFPSFNLSVDMTYNITVTP
jgi:hypothetical protein